MSGVAAAGESRVEATLERVLSDPLCTVRTVSAVSVSVSVVSVSAAVTAVTGAGLAVAASVLGVLVRAEAVSGAEAVLTVVSEAVHGLALGAAAEASSERASEAAGKAATVAGAAEAMPACTGKRSLLVPAERTGDLLE